MDGRFITEIRTAAASALATRALARPDARVVAILGTGVQAHAHMSALREVMHIEELRVWGRTQTKAADLVDFAGKCESSCARRHQPERCVSRCRRRLHGDVGARSDPCVVRH